MARRVTARDDESPDRTSDSISLAPARSRQGILPAALKAAANPSLPGFLQLRELLRELSTFSRRYTTFCSVAEQSLTSAGSSWSSGTSASALSISSSALSSVSSGLAADRHPPRWAPPKAPRSQQYSLVAAATSTGRTRIVPDGHSSVARRALSSTMPLSDSAPTKDPWRTLVFLRENGHETSLHHPIQEIAAPAVAS